MRLLATTPESNLARLPIAFDLRALSVTEGVRAGLSVATIVACAEWLHSPSLLEAALGALLTCLGDSGGPIRRRLPSLMAFTVIGSTLVVVCGLARAAGFWVSLPLGCAGVFALTYARVWGQASLQAGSLLLVVLIFGLDQPLDLNQALGRGALFGAGCLWATVLTLVIWRIHPFRPVRRAVAEIYRAVARLAADLRTLVASDAEDKRWDAHALGHRRAVRDTLEAGRTLVQDTLRVHGQASPRAYQALMRVEAADQLFGVMVALSDLLEADREPALHAAGADLLDALRPALLTVAEVIVADDPAVRADHPALGAAGLALCAAGVALGADPVTGAAEQPDGAAARLAAMTVALAAITASAAADTRLDPLARAVVKRLQTVVMLTVQPPAPDRPEPLRAVKSWTQHLLGPVRANLSWQSAILRHAVRAAAMVGPALAFTLNLAGGYEHWLTITMVVCLQPFYALTWQRAVERIGGTALGAVIAGMVGLVCTTPLAIAVALFPLSVLAFTLRAVNLGAFVACLTPLIVLLTEYGRPDTSELTIAALRAGYTVAGGLLAVAGAIVLWPSWEPDRLARELNTAILAHAAYAEADLDAILGEAASVDVDRARRAAGMASNNLETSISRALVEPGQRGRAGLQRAMVVDAALRRMAGRLSMLHLDPHGVDGVSETALRAWRGWVGGALRALAADEAGPGRAPEGQVPDALVRIARQVELMGGGA